MAWKLLDTHNMVEIDFEDYEPSDDARWVFETIISDDTSKEDPKEKLKVYLMERNPYGMAVDDLDDLLANDWQEIFDDLDIPYDSDEDLHRSGNKILNEETKFPILCFANIDELMENTNPDIIKKVIGDYTPLTNLNAGDLQDRVDNFNLNHSGFGSHEIVPIDLKIIPEDGKKKGFYRLSCFWDDLDENQIKAVEDFLGQLKKDFDLYQINESVCKNCINESADEDDDEDEDDDIKQRKKELADYLKIDVSDIKHTSGNYFETESEEWLVLTDEEADDESRQIIKDLIDSEGLGIFTEWFQDWIYENCMKEDVFDDVIQEQIDYYTDEEPDFDMVSYYNDLLDCDISNKVSLVRDEFCAGDAKEFKDWCDRNDAIDIDAVIDEEIDQDGRGHQISSYDGEEIELPNYYAYRIN